MLQFRMCHENKKDVLEIIFAHLTVTHLVVQPQNKTGLLVSLKVQLEATSCKINETNSESMKQRENNG